MDCLDVRLLLALERGGGESLDPTERAALQQHLDACPDCAALHRSEQVVDAAFGFAMRDVAVPPALKGRVLTRLAGQRPRRWPTAAAVAAALLLLIGGGATAWSLRPLPRVDDEVVHRWINGQRGTSIEEVEQWYRDRGIEMVARKQLDHQYLWWFDIAEFQGRRVPKMIFYNPEKNAVAQVIVLRTDQFDTSDLRDGFNGQTPNRIFVDRESEAGYVYLMGTSEQSEGAFLRGAPH